MRVFSLVLLLAGAQAAELASLDSWEQAYRSSVVLANLDASAANREITGSHEPLESALQPLWRWYRTVDAAHQAKAKEVMQGAGRTANAGDLAVVAVLDFKTKYDTLVSSPLTEGNAVATAKIMNKVLGAHEPDAPNAEVWKLYQAMDASTRAAVRTAIMEKPFLDKFHHDWKGASEANANAGKYKETVALVGNTMRGTLPNGHALTTDETGQKTKVWYSTVSEASQDLDDALLKHMRAVMMATLEDIAS